MSIDDFLDQMIQFSGIPGDYVYNNYAIKPNGKSLFFKRIHSSTEAAWRSLYIVTAPICLLLVATTFASLSLFHLACSAKETCLGDFNEAQLSLQISFTYLIESCQVLLLSLFSALINTIDLVGGLVNSAFLPNENDCFFGTSDQEGITLS